MVNLKTFNNYNINESRAEDVLDVKFLINEFINDNDLTRLVNFSSITHGTFLEKYYLLSYTRAAWISLNESHSYALFDIYTSTDLEERDDIKRLQEDLNNLISRLTIIGFEVEFSEPEKFKDVETTHRSLTINLKV